MNNIALYIEDQINRVHAYAIKNFALMSTLILLMIASYGFELFNLTLTIDEEIHAFLFEPKRWVEQGRWGMFLLNNFLFPQEVIPFVPLFIALFFHLLAMLLLLHSWNVELTFEKIIVGSVGVAYPGMAFMYTFSTINFGIGIGLFLVALSLFIYVTNQKHNKFYAVIPAAISISIYQGFAVALALAFLIKIISSEINSNSTKINVNAFFNIILVGVGAIVLYYLIQKFFMILFVTNIGYVDSFFDIDYLKTNTLTVFGRTLAHFLLIYLGYTEKYGSNLYIFGITNCIMLLLVILRIGRCKLSYFNKCVILMFTLLLLILPLTPCLLMRGTVSMRFLVALPILFSGFFMLGLQGCSKFGKLLTGSLVVLCVFQFVVSTNTLFASSNLALQADRLLASRLIERIDQAKSEARAKDLKYLEVVGYYGRPATRLIPKIETFGASFFEWDQGNANRVSWFLQTLGFDKLSALAVKDRAAMVEIAQAMPIWPESGSVKIIGETILIKFGEYSKTQINSICSSNK